MTYLLSLSVIDFLGFHNFWFEWRTSVEELNCSFSLMLFSFYHNPSVIIEQTGTEYNTQFCIAGMQVCIATQKKRY